MLFSWNCTVASEFADGEASICYSRPSPGAITGIVICASALVLLASALLNSTLTPPASAVARIDKFEFLARIVSGIDNLQFLADIIPSTNDLKFLTNIIPLKLVKAKAYLPKTLAVIAFPRVMFWGVEIEVGEVVEDCQTW